MNTVAVAFDTHKAVSSLEKRGLSKDAAEGITDLLKQVTETNLVSKTDLKIALQEQTTSLVKWIAAVLIAHGAGTAALTVALIQLLG